MAGPTKMMIQRQATAAIYARHSRDSQARHNIQTTATSSGRGEACISTFGSKLCGHFQISFEVVKAALSWLCLKKVMVGCLRNRHKNGLFGSLRMQWSRKFSPQRQNKHRTIVQAALLEERTLVTRVPAIEIPGKALAYELIQGALARWSEVRDRAVPEPPTAVLLHGILGGRRNWASFAKRLAQEFPTWQFLLVDLRCHGESAFIRKRGPHSVASAARDVLQLMGQLRLTPRVLIGHSFGGKVAMSMVDQAAKPLARPVRVWVLDATPGKVRSGGDGEDHPAELIASLRQMPSLLPSRRALIEALSHQGFSAGVAQWMTTNLKARPKDRDGKSQGYQWVFNLEGIADMYRSYEDTNLWPLVDNVPEGVHIDFLKAERSLHRWAHEDVQRIHSAEMLASTEGAGVQMHVLEDAGHWVHTDNPDGLFRVLAPSFGCAVFQSR